MEQYNRNDDELLLFRCDEIASQDEKYQKLLNQVNNAYSDMQKANAKFINATSELQAYSEKLMLKNGIEISNRTKYRTEYNLAK